MEIMEDKKICATCGGKCCKKSGCDYAASDFNNLDVNFLYEILMEGKISIVSTIYLEKLANGKCHPNISQIELIKTWDSYQRVLGKLVKKLLETL